MKQYRTLDNGGYPYLVKMENNIAKIYNNPEKDEFTDEIEKKLLKTVKYKKAFIGARSKT